MYIVNQNATVTDIYHQSDKAATLDISTNDFVSPSFFPCDLAAEGAPPLIHGFISSNRVVDFISRLQLTTIQKLVPGLRKEGYTESEDVAPNASGSRPRPDAPPPARPQPYAPPNAPERSPLAVPPRNPYEIGRRDLDPLPRNPFRPPSLFPDNEDDGMFVGPNHPIFGQGQRGRGQWGGDGFLPPMGAPPGARFDPIGPGPLPMPGRGAFPRMPGAGNMHDPDNDDFMPPGAVSPPVHVYEVEFNHPAW